MEETSAQKITHNKHRATWRQQNPAKTRYNNIATEFVCVDGEGITLPDGTHRYVLLGIGNKQIANPDGLSWEECFEFLWSEFRTGSVAYTGFFLSYDFTQMLRSLPEERARMLLTADGRLKRKPRSAKMHMPFPVRYGEWEFDILGTKRLKIRKKGSKRWMHICDTGPFFQKSFLKVIDPKEWSDPVVSQEEYETISAGKSRRVNAMLDDNMRYYNRLENEILSRVLYRLNEGFQELGIHLKPSQWFGPGQAAQAWLKGRVITPEQLAAITPWEVLEATIASYYGGWFEIFAHGFINGTSWEYDINSAYPYIISALPCLEHGEWKHNAATYTNYTLVYAVVRGENRHIGSMLHRDAHGNIFRPHCTEGWYWYDELEAARKATLVTNYNIRDSYTYIPCDCPPPLAEVRDIYNLRLQVGKKTPLGIACKLVPNSLYGKFAQSIEPSMYGNPIYASLITSGCRTMILNAIATHPKGTSDVLMVATDGVYFRTQHPNLPLSPDLGHWEETQKENLTLFKPGVYWDDKARDTIASGQAPIFKARGVNARDFAQQLENIDIIFKNNIQTREFVWPKVEFPITFAMVTATQALQYNKWHLAGTLINDPTGKQSANPLMKRSAWYWNDDIIRSRPRVNDPYEPSHPYQKRFGLEDPFSLESQENSGATPDGYPSTLWKEALYDD